MLASCWTWDVDPVILDIYGPIQIRWYGLAFLAVFYFGWKLQDWQFRRAGRSPETASRFVNWGVIAVLAGSWFGHRIFYEWDEVVKNPLYLIDVRKGIAGLASHGATFGMITAFIFFGRKYKIPLGEMFDRTMWSCAAASFVRLGNFFNSEVVGRPSEVPWAVCLPRFDRSPPHGTAEAIARHPSQLYEFLIGLAILALLTLVDRLAGKEKRPRWLIMGTFFASYFGARFFVEMVKKQQGGLAGDSEVITTGGWLSVPFFLLGVGFIIYSLVKREPASGPPSDFDRQATAAVAPGVSSPKLAKSKKK